MCTTYIVNNPHCETVQLSQLRLVLDTGMMMSHELKSF